MCLSITPLQLGASRNGRLSAAVRGVWFAYGYNGRGLLPGGIPQNWVNARSVFRTSVLLVKLNQTVKSPRVIKQATDLIAYIYIVYFRSVLNIFSVEYSLQTRLLYLFVLALICVNHVHQWWIFFGSCASPWLSAPGVCPRNGIVYSGIARIPSE